MTTYTPNDYVITVYETKELAEIGDDKNALYVFQNRGDGANTANPAVSNSSQCLFGTCDTNTANKVVSSTAAFGSRLDGKTLTNHSKWGGTSAVIDSFDSSTQLGFTSDICPDGNETFYIDNPGFYFTFVKYYYRIEANDVVKGFIIDWDDGEDNSPQKANRQTITLDEPNSWVVVEHTYTKHGKFYPMIRTISIDGFYSKWYTSHDAKSYLSSIEPQYNSLPSGQNEWSTVSLDNEQTTSTSSKPRIPEFVPANMPPIAKLQLDRKVVFSGIDNSIISGNVVGYAYVPRVDNSLTSFNNSVEVIYKTTTERILKETIAAASALKGAGCIFPSDTSTNGYLKELLSVKIIKMKEGSITSDSNLGPDERLHIMITTGSANAETDYVITTVSLGNPIQTLNRPGFSVLADGTMSQTKCSNVSISKYIFDTGKLPTEPTEDYNFIIPDADQISDVIRGSSDTDSSYEQTDDKLRIHYSFKPNKKGGNVIDSTTKRFYDEERLIRLQVQDSSEDTNQDNTLEFYTDDHALAGVALFWVQYQGWFSAFGWGPPVFGKTPLANDDVDLTQYAIVVYIDSSPAEPPESPWLHYLNYRFKGVKAIKINDEYMKFKGIGYEFVDPDGDGGLSAKWIYYMMVERGIQGTTIQTHAFGDPIYPLSSMCRTIDSCKYSFIEHNQHSLYYDEVSRPDSLKSRGLLFYANSISSEGANTLGDETWTYAGFRNNNNLYEGDHATVYNEQGDRGLVFGGVKKSSGVNHTQLTHGGLDGHKERASNWLLCTKTDKFNKLFLRLNNNYVSINSGAVKYSDDIWPSGTDVNITAWYTALEDKTGSTYIWKPLSFVDGTSTGSFAQSLRKSGSITFDIPDDWVSIVSEDISSWAGGLGNPVPEQNSTTGAWLELRRESSPATMWQDNQYGLLIGISVNGSTTDFHDKINCNYIVPYSNSHSSVITLRDPHHKSLNDITIAQSISWSRSSNLMNITDRLGRSEIRKIGAQGGSISFGGVELSGSYNTTKAAILRYQREGTPVYLDVERTNGDFVRFYGIIGNLSEDVPTGKSIPKWGVTMQIEYIAEYTSDGDWISDGLMSLGGEVVNEPKYLL